MGHAGDGETSGSECNEPPRSPSKTLSDLPRRQSDGRETFPAKLGCPYQRVHGPRSPELERRHADAGELVVRLAARLRDGRAHEDPGAEREQSLMERPRSKSASLLPDLRDEESDMMAVSTFTPAWRGAPEARNVSPQLPAPPIGTQQPVSRTASVAEGPCSPKHAFESPDDTVIIFDWDDTLFPTWFITEVVMPCLPPELKTEGVLPGDSPFVAPLSQHASTVRDLLTTARGIGRVGIVTLAQRPWVTSSASRFLPGLDFDGLLQELDIPVVYARECLKRPMISQATVEEGVNLFTIAKQAAMLKALKKLYGKRPWRNVISIGDSIVERDAITDVLWSHDQGTEWDRAPCCKTVKLIEEPSSQQLGAQLVLLGMWLRSMASHGEDFDVVMDDSEEMMVRMHEKFSS